MKSLIKFFLDLSKWNENIINVKNHSVQSSTNSMLSQTPWMKIWKIGKGVQAVEKAAKENTKKRNKKERNRQQTIFLYIHNRLLSFKMLGACVYWYFEGFYFYYLAQIWYICPDLATKYYSSFVCAFAQ